MTAPDPYPSTLVRNAHVFDGKGDALSAPILLRLQAGMAVKEAAHADLKSAIA